MPDPINLIGGEYPTNIHAETTILGAMLVEPESIYDATEWLTTEDFCLGSHRMIYGGMLRLIEDRSPIDIITVTDELSKSKELDSVGGLPYLASLSEGLPRKLNIQSYVRIVRDAALLRRGMQACERYRSEMALHEEEAMAIFAKLQMEFMDLAAGKTNQTAESLGDIVPRVVAKIAEERQNPSREDALGFTYGVPEVDKMTKGMFGGEYTIILAETGGAKTVWMTQILLDNALKGVKSKMFSMEMKKEQMVRRMLSSISRIVKAKDIRDPRWMDAISFDDLQKTARLLSTLGISIDDSRQLPLDQMIARARVAIQRDGVRIIGVDYLQLMRAPTTYKRMTDTERIEMVTLALRDLSADCLDYGAHVLALSQYSRPADGGRGRPENSRAKGSSSLEQSCQVMMHIVRERLEDRSLSTDVEIIIGKQREGRFGSVRCVLDEDHLRFKPTLEGAE